MPVNEDDYVSLSALQHYVFCPRQCALIHVEREWAENALTTFGKLEHERVDSLPGSTRGCFRTARSVRLVCHRLGIHGVADVVEYENHSGAGNASTAMRVTPVEYKHGRPKVHKADEVQLCAQALCLEEMHGVTICRGYLYYRSTKHRKEIVFDAALRALTEKIILSVRELLTSGYLPPACRMDACEACSLQNQCLPLPPGVSASEYNERNISSALKDR